jgi:hypothetical protein
MIIVTVTGTVSTGKASTDRTGDCDRYRRTDYWGCVILYKFLTQSTFLGDYGASSLQHSNCELRGTY